MTNSFLGDLRQNIFFARQLCSMPEMPLGVNIKLFHTVIFNLKKKSMLPLIGTALILILHR